MASEALLQSIFVIFSGAAVLATVALFARQSMLVSYIVLGIFLGPQGVGLVGRPEIIQQISHVGIIFLLFLLGLNLHPQKLLLQLREAVTVTVASSLAFGSVGFAVALAFGFSPTEGLVLAAACTFSSTIIGLKLLPTTQLHHQHAGEVIISILLLQDLIAIVLLLVLQAVGQHGRILVELGLLSLALPAVTVLAFLGARYVLLPLFARFDTIHEYVFLIAIGWCLGVAELATYMNLSEEIGAFIAGVALATNPISTFIAESLKPLRDFFLVMFFFSLGATFDLGAMGEAAIPALLLAAALLLLKPPVFRYLLRRSGESGALAGEVGGRLGQMSEFALFIAVLAEQVGAIGSRAGYLIQLATLMTFVVSSYVIMLRYPTPIAVSARLRRD